MIRIVTLAFVPAAFIASAVWAFAVPEATKNVGLNIPAWSPQTQQPADGGAIVRAEGFVLTRGAQGDSSYMLRVYGDIPVTPGCVYVLSYAVKVEGQGGSMGIVFNGDQQGKWDETNPKYIGQRKKCDFTTIKAILVAPRTAVRFRIDLRATGANTTVTYKDIVLEEIGPQKDVVIVPSDAAVTLDGKIDDPLWASAERLSPFRVLGEVERPSALKNEAMVAVMGGYLYVAYRMEEPNTAAMKMLKPKGTVGTQGPLSIYADDCAETFLSVDQLSYSHVIVNAAGTRHWDQQNLGQPSATWYPSTRARFTGEWDARAAVGRNEWTCEFRVRLSDLYGQAVGGDQKLFVNFTRHRTQGKEENLTWAPIAGQFYASPKEFVPITLKLPAVVDSAGTTAALRGTFTRTLTVPDLLLAGAPVKLTKHTGAFRLPSATSLSEKQVAIDSGVKTALTDALIVATGGKARLSLQVADVFGDSSLTTRQRGALKSPEAFRLELTPGKAAITGRSREGVLRGIATLILMANRARFTKDAALPALTLYDAPRMPFRGMMVSLTKRVIDVAYLMRINKLLVYLDSFGGPTVFPFDSYPIGGKGTTKEALASLFNYARARGIEPIPYFASWGRVQYLKNAPGAGVLLVDDVNVLQEGYRNLDVANPETHKVMLGLQEEILNALKPEGFCIAMDEAHFGHMVTSAAARARNWKPSDWYVEALNVDASFLRSKGVRMYVWGDMMDPGHNGGALDMSGPQLLARLPKDMTVLDWKYDGSLDYTVDYPSIKMFRDAGLRTIGAPWFSPKSIPRLAHAIAKHKGDGLLLTAWNDSSPEGMPTEWIRACALTAYYTWSPEDCDLSHLPFVPDAIMEGAAYWAKGGSPAGAVKSLSTTEALIGGDDLAKLLGLPAGTDIAFIATPFKNYRDVGFNFFTRAGKPAAVALAGRDFAVVKNGDFAQGLNGWIVETPGEDAVFTTENGALKATRVTGNAFRRVYQDLRVDPGKEYFFRFKVKVDGPGTAHVWTYSGDAGFKWDLAKSVYASATEREWTVKEVPLPPGFGSARLCFSVIGPSTTAWFDDAAIVEKGADAATAPLQKAVIPVNATARVITFMHATSRQVIAEEDMHGNTAKFASSVPGEYLVTYTDGTNVTIPLTYRVNIVAANDPTLGRETDVGLFGTVGGALFVNLPTFTWVNPHPEKAIASLEARSGNRSDMSLLVFGISLD